MLEKLRKNLERGTITQSQFIERLALESYYGTISLDECTQDEREKVRFLLTGTAPL